MKISFQKSLFLLSALMGTYALAANLTDGEVAKILIDTQTSEIDAARSAMKNSTSKEVKAYADSVIKEESKNKDKLQQIVRDAKLELKNTGKGIYNQAKVFANSTEASVKKGVQFDRTYLQGQIDLHQQFLTDLDKIYIPVAKNAELKSFLKEMKAETKSQLKEAQEVKANLK